jgi:hypothetical protein
VAPAKILTALWTADPSLLTIVGQCQGVAHLAVRVRDGTSLVGPLVVPGVTSCLTDH